MPQPKHRARGNGGRKCDNSLRLFFKGLFCVFTIHCVQGHCVCPPFCLDALFYNLPGALRPWCCCKEARSLSHSHPLHSAILLRVQEWCSINLTQAKTAHFFFCQRYNVLGCVYVQVWCERVAIILWEVRTRWLSRPGLQLTRKWWNSREHVTNAYWDIHGTTMYCRTVESW